MPSSLLYGKWVKALGPLAQLVLERVAVNREVLGSNPRGTVPLVFVE